MAIYPDKRDGKLTGHFLVDLKQGRNGDRYKKRHQTLQAAQEDEKRVLECWATGKDPKALQGAPAAPVGLTLTKAIDKAERIMWRGKACREGNFQNLRVIERLMGADTPLAKIDTDKVREMIEKLDKRGVSDGTVNRYLSHFRTFLKWHIGEKNLHEKFVDLIVWDWRDEKSDKKRRWITLEEEAQLVSLLPSGTAKLVKVAIATGCRREELMGADNQLDQEGDEPGVLYLWKTKNDDPRSVPVTAETAQLLRDLLDGEMPSKRTLRRHWDKAKAEMGLADDKGFVFHSCRHTWATRAVDANIDVLVIKEWLGHKRIETTQRYAKVGANKLMETLHRVGEHRSLEASKNQSKSQISAVPPRSPQGSPTGGNMAQNGALDRAA
jgi:integrase